MEVEKERYSFPFSSFFGTLLAFAHLCLFHSNGCSIGVGGDLEWNNNQSEVFGKDETHNNQSEVADWLGIHQKMLD